MLFQEKLNLFNSLFLSKTKYFLFLSGRMYKYSCQRIHLGLVRRCYLMMPCARHWGQSSWSQCVWERRCHSLGWMSPLLLCLLMLPCTATTYQARGFWAWCDCCCHVLGLCIAMHVLAASDDRVCVEGKWEGPTSLYSVYLWLNYKNPKFMGACPWLFQRGSEPQSFQDLLSASSSPWTNVGTRRWMWDELSGRCPDISRYLFPCPLTRWLEILSCWLSSSLRLDLSLSLPHEKPNEWTSSFHWTCPDMSEH